MSLSTKLNNKNMESTFSKVGLALVKILPKDWEKALLFAHVTECSYELFYYAKVNGNYINNFDLEKEGLEVNRQDVRKHFREIYEILLPDFRENQWYAITFILSKTGEFTVDYEYTDYSEESFAYKELWKEKYLKG